MLQLENIHEDKYVIVRNTRYVYISNSKINTLIVGKTVRRLECNNCEIQTLNLDNANNLVFLECRNNKLTELTIPPLCATVSASGNQLTSLKLRDNNELWYLDIRDNNITHIDFDFPDHFQELYIDGNPPIHFKSGRWIFTWKCSPSVGICKGDWSGRKPYCGLEIECLHHKMDEPIVI